MTQSTYFNQVKNVLKVLQGYTKGIRFIALLTMLCTIGVGQMWGAGTWTLVKDASTLTAGVKVIIVAKDNDFAMSTTQNTNNRGQVAVTKNGETLTYTTAVQELTLKDGKTSGTLAFYTGSGYLYAASSSKNYLKTETTLSANSSWNITIANTGAATIKATGSNTRNWLRYNSSNNPPIFSCYSSGQSDVCLYKYVEEQGGDEGGGETPDPTPSKLSTPANLKEASIAETSDTLSWDAVANASNYSVTINGNTATANSNSYSATGLTAGTAYTWSVVAKGDGTNYTDSDAAQHTFTTTAATTPDPGTGGEALSYTWDLSKKTYSAASENQVTWSATDVNMVADRGTAGTAPNNYLGGDANNRTSSRFYQNSILTITPKANVTITSVVFTATSTNYATAIEGSTWTNATASANNTTVTVTPIDGTTAISAKIGGTCGFTGVTVNYTKAASDDPEPVIVKTLKSIAVTGMTTTFEQGDVFKFDGTCTATYSVTKDGVAQADETAEVTPTSVSKPNMNTIGNQTVTVTYSEGGVDKTDEYEITITENTITAGEYCIIPNNDFWGTNFSGSITGDALNQTYIGRQDDITIQYAKGSGSNLYINDSQTRTYSGTTLTFSVPSGYLITAIAFTADGNNWDGTHTANAGSMTDSKNWAGSANEVTITFGDKCFITKICVTYEAIDLTLPSAPTFTPAAGTYNAVQNVTISAEAGTTIYYTLGGTDPTTESNVYSTPIEIAETKTLKAIAVKDEKVSPVASATYTINLPLTTMDQIFAKATAVGSTATSVEITFDNWVVSAVKGDGKTAFVTDGTKGFAIFDKDVNLGFSVGNTLSGTATCKVQLYNGFAELTELKSNTAGLSVGSGGTITTQELDVTAIEALTGVNTGSLIKINGICSSTDSKYYVADVQIYTSLYNFGTLEVGAEYNITGIYQQYHSTQEMLPRSAEDIEKVVGLPTATITIADITMEVGETKTIEATITPDVAQSTVQYAITAGSEYIDLDGTTITAVAAGTATITATIAEKADEYKGATKEFTITVKPQNIAVLPFAFDSGKDDIENTLGMSQNGLGSDYGSAPLLKFDGTGDYVIIHFNGEPGMLSYDIKGNSYSGGTFTVQESADGSAYTNIVGYTELGSEETKTHTLAATSRYVKFIYTEKVSGNVALGNITISKPDNRAEAGLAWNPSAVTLTQGDAFTAPTLNNPYSVAGITYESNNTNVATVTDAGIISLAEATGEATITASFAGNKDYKPITVTCIITISAPPHRVTWLVNGKLLTDAELSDASTYVYEGESITKTPPAPNPEDFCGQVFVGWTDAENGEYVHGTSNLYATPLDFPTASADQIFYAVFADYEQQ